MFTQKRSFMKRLNRKGTPLAIGAILFGLFGLPFKRYFGTRKIKEEIANEKKVTLYIATSIDGYIADVHGGFNFLDGYNPDDYGYSTLWQNSDAILMGGRTYRQVCHLSKDTNYPYAEKLNVIYTTDKSFEESEKIKKIEGDVEQLKKLITKLKDEGKNIWLVGGAELNYKMETSGLIDQYIITIVPVILGEGIPLFQKPADESSVVPLKYDKLKLISHESYNTGVVQNTYVKGNPE